MNAIALSLYDTLTNDLERISKHFKAPKLTLIVRNPHLEDGDVVMSDDDLDAAIAAIERLKARRALP